MEVWTHTSTILKAWLEQHIHFKVNKIKTWPPLVDLQQKCSDNVASAFIHRLAHSATINAVCISIEKLKSDKHVIKANCNINVAFW